LDLHGLTGGAGLRLRGSIRSLGPIRFLAARTVVVSELPSILITDDDREFRETLREVFEPQGFRTFTAGDGEEALTIVRTQPVHLVLLDMHMPKLTGLETLRMLKQLRALLPCILMSANADETLVQQALHLQAFTVLAKPVTRNRITDVVRDALQVVYNWPKQGLGRAG
jgi:CheY-like chemotaxis protein